nr:MAG TPA: tail tape measure protein [Caudoviricetes sp.]
MDIFSLVGKITINYADAVNNIEKVSKSAKDTAETLENVDKKADSAGDSVEDAGQAAKNADSGFTTWKATLANLASTAITKVISGCTQLAEKMADVTKSAVGHYAEYEQLVGGVETLFKDSSGKLIGYAEKAYKTAGMSSNQYMDTATSFAASLIQGLGGDTAKAVELTNLAITDMSDNANKMGTDIGSIQDAYQGFAKQNYTMLDNLKLGYGGTQSEMIRLINDSGVLGEKIESLDNVTFDQMIEAIHKIQDNLGITGTTALEAGTTISGSWSSVQALFENILTKVGSKLAPTVMGFLQQLSDWMETIDWDAFATSVGDALQRVFDWIQKIDFTTFFEKGMDGVENFLEKLGGLIEDVPKIIQTFKDWSPLIAGVAAGFVTLKVAMAISSLISAITTAWTAYKTANEGATIAQWLFNAALNANPIVLIVTLIAGLVVALITLWNTNDGFREAVTNAWEFIKNAVSTALDAISTTISNIWNAIKTTVTNVINSIKSVISSVFNAIKSTISSILNSIKSTFTSVWNSIKSTVSNVINGVKSTISSGLNAAKSTVSGVLNSIKAVFSNVWNGCKSVVSNAINHIKSIMHFSWSLPHLKLPHISISGSFSLKPPSVPHFGIEWYKKAMDDGMILNQPTIFGYNAKSNRFLAGGEAGSETVVGTQNLMDMIQEAVNNSGNRDDGAIQALLEAIYNWMRNGGLYTLLIDALTNGVEVEFDNREIARLVKKYA